MPNLQSAKKALRQNKRRRAVNQKYKDAMKALVKKADKLVVAKNVKEAKKLLPKIYKALDKAAKRGVIKKNAAARTKSRLAKRMNKIS